MPSWKRRLQWRELIAVHCRLKMPHFINRLATSEPKVLPVRGGGRSSAAVYTRYCVASLNCWDYGFVRLLQFGLLIA